MEQIQPARLRQAREGDGTKRHDMHTGDPDRLRPDRTRRGETDVAIRLTCTALLLAQALAVPALAAGDTSPTHYDGRTEYRAPRAPVAPTIDGVGDEAVWQEARWQELSHRWLGPEYSADDFQGRYKVVWSAERIHILVEIVDDVLIDRHRDPLVRYWDDDCLEIFLDEDFSGGEHQYNHNAFAYHVSLDNQAVDIGTDRNARDYSHHVDSRWKQSAGKVTWELSIAIYTDAYADGAEDNVPVALSSGKTLGLMVAYCDNDGSDLRENFIGSESVPDGPKDRGWIDAGLFGSLLLVE
jgi:hypothetical protein